MSQKWLILLAFVFAAYLAAQTSNQNNFGGGSTLPTNLTFVAPTLTVSAATFGSGILALSGNTSGTATFTAPAVAGTRTNQVVVSNVLGGAVGSITAPTYSFSTQTGTGLYQFASASNSMCYASGGVASLCFAGAQLRSDANGLFGFTNSNTDPSLGTDIAISRDAAGVLDVGSVNGDTTGKVKAAGYLSAGTTFTSNAGCSETSLAGGATAGKFNAGAVSCTLIVTMGNSATAPNGWACRANDLTTSADTMVQTATAATTATFSGTVVSGDVINFSCIGY